jgi:3'-phosphoadenosine 5'-phosphosulfate sulfotransferase (PAPS reductase)/FAD synthetase
MSIEQTSFFEITPWRAQILAGGRTVCWFSCGAASAVATWMALQKYRGKRPVHICYTDTGSEHPDNARFLAECETWYGQKIEILRHHKYKSVSEVIMGERYLNGPGGAKCTDLLKREVRLAYQRGDSDIQVFGFDSRPNDVARAERFRREYFDLTVETPLIESGMRHADCLAVLRAKGIEVPMMYRLGYKNNNCIGCVKGGAGYWNKIRIDFPEVFAERASQERIIGHSCLNGTFLDELKPGTGRYESEEEVECGLLCSAVVNEEVCEA